LYNFVEFYSIVSVKLPECYNGHFVDFRMLQIILISFYSTVDVHLTCLNKDYLLITYNTVLDVSNSFD